MTFFGIVVSLVRRPLGKASSSLKRKHNNGGQRRGGRTTSVESNIKSSLSAYYRDLQLTDIDAIGPDSVNDGYQNHCIEGRDNYCTLPS